MGVLRLLAGQHRLDAAHGGTLQGGVQQGIDGEGGDAEHDNLGEGVVATEVHQDHVDYVGAPASGLRFGKVIIRDGGAVPGHHAIGETGDAEARQAGKQAVAPAHGAAVLGWGRLGQEVEREQHQDGRHHIHGNLCQREVRGGELEEGEGHDDADDACEDERREPVAMVQQHHAAGEEKREEGGRRGRAHRQQGRAPAPWVALQKP